MAAAKVEQMMLLRRNQSVIIAIRAHEKKLAKINGHVLAPKAAVHKKYHGHHSVHQSGCYCRGVTLWTRVVKNIKHDNIASKGHRATRHMVLFRFCLQNT